jgi:hypothetical protein
MEVEGWARTEEAVVGGGREALGPGNGSRRPQRLRCSKKMIAAILAANQQRAHERLAVGGKLLAISPPVNNHGWPFFLVSLPTNKGAISA